MTPIRVGCRECDDRPDDYFRQTRYLRGFIWHFDAPQEFAFLETESAHELHAGFWSLIISAV